MLSNRALIKGTVLSIVSSTSIDSIESLSMLSIEP